MKKLLLVTTLFVFTCTGFAQFTSTTAVADFVTNPSNQYGLDSMSLTSEILQVRVTPNDLNYVGRINVLVYDSISGSAMSMLSISRADIQTGAPVDNGAIVFNFPWLSRGVVYHLVVEAQNFQGGYLPATELYYREN